MKFYFLIILFISCTIKSQSKVELINALNSKINYQEMYQKMSGAVIYDKVLDEYKFFSIFEVLDKKFSTVCTPFTKDDVQAITSQANNKFMVILNNKKCTFLVEDKSKNTSEVSDIFGFILKLQDDSTTYQSEKFLEVLKLIFEK